MSVRHKETVRQGKKSYKCAGIFRLLSGMVWDTSTIFVGFSPQFPGSVVYVGVHTSTGSSFQIEFHNMLTSRTRQGLCDIFGNCPILLEATDDPVHQDDRARSDLNQLLTSIGSTPHRKYSSRITQLPATHTPWGAHSFFP